jgi:hypothetical protein
MTQGEYTAVNIPSCMNYLSLKKGVPVSVTRSGEIPNKLL